ncbi:hypothetical protein ElyMa_002694600 [Elysia marginata]|uniref:Uncharacterized protein n=1 Tax=Elysia marginata TaxID=1093978 RepID=A0AAV4HFF6_9GAST|nr:hypothetical protein ElyMa_002694600 [Elysia marginata]
MSQLNTGGVSAASGGGDGQTGGLTPLEASAPSYEEVVQPGGFMPLPPPPSYEEAASGKYDPKPM